MERFKDPLVSIVVITYNSSKFVLECLESIAAQTYENIELIISDDCSQDNTADLCKKWLANHAHRFTNTELIEVEQNTGITKNINRGCRLAKGEWIKPLAGDDLLLPKCIELNIEHSQGKEVLFSQMEVFSEEGNLGYALSDENKPIYELSAKKQFEKLFLFNFVSAPSGFINKGFLQKMAYFDENYEMMEDYPFWLKTTYSGVKLYYFDDVTVRYRKHAESVSTREYSCINERLHSYEKKILKDYLFKRVKLCLKIRKFFTLLINDCVIEKGNDCVFFMFCNRINYLNPCYYASKVKMLLTLNGVDK